jgi:hypothetical protein
LDKTQRRSNPFHVTLEKHLRSAEQAPRKQKNHPQNPRIRHLIIQVWWKNSRRTKLKPVFAIRHHSPQPFLWTGTILRRLTLELMSPQGAQLARTVVRLLTPHNFFARSLWFGVCGILIGFDKKRHPFRFPSVYFVFISWILEKIKH